MPVADSFAVPCWHTILIDGVNDFLPEETYATTTPQYTAYLACDGEYLYVGYDGPFIGIPEERWIVLYLDTIPGEGLDHGLAIGGQEPQFPAGFLADFALNWKVDDSSFVILQNQAQIWESMAGVPVDEVEAGVAARRSTAPRSAAPAMRSEEGTRIERAARWPPTMFRKM